ncbi:hypothetical protein RO3G_09320 [Rhizopus delemar RA 99-880]|uniref:Uncharacterized protein n=1 Tax=Rhizopus delemar (strain RA 99-880 / ATCC MYA-4621 / FGSC 9543 / NRRL 43880) TaxID=246409 RepID=I1C830_RHIO9|nr:hypothetical protein RO3G_09320 [Rhizopus delemar RA 99-880]|eukprot:EIE84610.1 hypothetical protein RO3G_09320 [Rhizopus delemar RA 99-880]
MKTIPQWKKKNSSSWMVTSSTQSTKLFTENERRITPVPRTGGYTANSNYLL